MQATTKLFFPFFPSETPYPYFTRQVLPRVEEIPTPHLGCSKNAEPHKGGWNVNFKIPERNPVTAQFQHVAKKE